MHSPRTITEPATRQGRSPAHAATLMLAMFVFAAIPAVSIAQGLDAAVLAELMREEGRRLPPREPDSAPKGLRAAAPFPRTLRSNNPHQIARPRVTMARRDGFAPILPITASDPRPVMHHLHEAMLALPPPAR